MSEENATPNSEQDDGRCGHGTPEDELCGRCERNPDCNWNEGGASGCFCDVGSG